MNMGLECWSHKLMIADLIAGRVVHAGQLR
jgi:hypothetical protein